MPELFAEQWALTLAFPAISFIHFKLIFIPADKVTPINQCPGFELDPVAFNLSQPRMLKLCGTARLPAGSYRGFYFGLDCISTLRSFQATMLIKLLQHSMCVFTCLLRSHPSPHPPCVFIVARLFCSYFMLITPAETLSPLHILSMSLRSFSFSETYIGLHSFIEQDGKFGFVTCQFCFLETSNKQKRPARVFPLICLYSSTQ